MLSLLKVCRCKFSPWGKLWSHKPCGMAKKKKSYYLPLWRSHIPLAFGIFPDQISNPCPLHWQVNSYPLYLQWSTHFSSVQSLSRVWLLATPWTAVHQASQSITNSWSLLKLMSIELVMPSNHLILCHPLLLLPPIPPSIRVFSNDSAVCFRWPKYWSFSFSASVLPMNTQDWSPLGWTGWISLQSKGLSRGFSNTTVQKHQFFGAQLSLYSNSHIHTWPQEKP